MISKRVFLIGLVILINYYHVQSLANVCQSDVCKEYAKFVKENIDSSIDPCDDFYKFSCGNFLRTHKPKDDQEYIDASMQFEEKNKIKFAKLLNEPTSNNENLWTRYAKNLYASCINMDRVETYSEPYFINFIDEELKGWPLITELDNKLDLLELMRIINRYSSNIFVKTTVVPNPKDPKTNIIKVEQPNYISYETFNSTEFQSASMNYFRTIVGFMKPKTKTLRNLETDLIEMHTLTKKIIEATLKTIEKNDENDKEMTLSELQKKIPDFPWIEWIKTKIFIKTFGLAITDDYPILVSDWSYMVKIQDVFSYYSKNKKRVVQNYVIGDFIFNDLNQFLPEKYLLADLPTSTVINGIEALKPRDMYCLDKTSGLLKDETGYVWVQHYFKKSAKDDVKQINGDILNSLFKNIMASDWLDANSKSKSIVKALSIKQMIGYPDKYDDPVYINKTINYIINPNNFVSNYLRISRAKRIIEEMGRLKKTNDNNDMKLPFSVSESLIKSDQEKLNIFINAGIISLPFYDSSLPRYVDYGGVGYLIAKLYTNFFSNKGRKYDENGKFLGDDEGGIWTKKTIDKFKEKTSCMIDQYNQFYIKDVDKYINGTLTLDENISSNGGLKVAYTAYSLIKPKSEPKLPGLENYTDEQLFFIASTQPFCTLYNQESLSYYVSEGSYAVEEARLEALARNSEGFRQAFKCNDKKRKYKTCSFW